MTTVDDCWEPTLVELSTAWDAPIEVPGPNVNGLIRAGVAYILRSRRCFLADPSGFPKMSTTAAAIAIADQWPVVVVTRPALIRSWAAELALWLPGKEVRVADGRDPFADLAGVDVLIVGYTRLDGGVFHINALHPRFLVFDQCDAIKNHQAKTTKAAVSIAKKMPEDGYVVCVSPQRSDPGDLVSALTALNRIDLFHGRREFLERYAPQAFSRQGKWQQAMPVRREDLKELAGTLSAHCWIRRFLPPDGVPMDTVTVNLDAVASARYAALAAESAELLIAEAKALPERPGWEEIETIAAAFSGQTPWAHAGFADRKSWLAWQTADRIASAPAGQDTFMRFQTELCRLKMPSLMRWLNTYLDRTTRRFVLVAASPASAEMVREAVAGVAPAGRVTVAVSRVVDVGLLTDVDVVFVDGTERWSVPSSCPGVHEIIASGTVESIWSRMLDQNPRGGAVAPIALFVFAMLGGSFSSPAP